MNKLNDKDLREALRRHEAKRLKPQVSEDFCDKVMQALTETDTVSSEQPKRRLWLYPAIGIAAAIALLFSLSVALSHQDGEEPSIVAQTDSTRVTPQTDTKKAEERLLEEKGNKEMADTVKKLKEMLQMAKPPRHYMARQETKAENHAEPELIDEEELDERAFAEERIWMEMERMEQTSGSLQADFKTVTEEIRQRGERISQHVVMAMSNEE